MLNFYILLNQQNNKYIIIIKVSDTEQLDIHSKNVMGKAANNQEQQALESIDPRMLPNCRGIPIETTNKSKFRGVSKIPKSAKKSSVKARKRKLLKDDDFRENDNLGTISPSGQYVCPKCDMFETKYLHDFRAHLYEEINSNKK